MEHNFSLGTLQGVDLSIWVDCVNWSEIAQSTQLAFAFVECAHGIEIGRSFANIWGDRDSKIACGPFQRLFSTESGRDQANAFIEAFEKNDLKLEDGDLPPVLDVEYDVDSRQNSELTGEQYIAMMDEWIEIIEGRFHRRPILYTGPSFWNGYLHSPGKFSTLPLWIAQYNVEEPDIPQPWTSYTFWQYAENASVRGCDKEVDRDHFAGNAADLTALIETSKL